MEILLCPMQRAQTQLLRMPLQIRVEEGKPEETRDQEEIPNLE